MYFAIAYIPYCVSLIMITKTHYIFINNRTFSCCKIWQVSENNYELSSDTNDLGKFEKYLKQSNQAPLIGNSYRPNAIILSQTQQNIIFKVSRE